MKYLVGIPYVNRPDLLEMAVNSIKTFWPHAIIIDNSEGRDLRAYNKLPPDISIYEPPVPLSFSQTMNLLQRLAVEQQCDVIMFMHNDAEAHVGTPEKLLSIVEELLQSKERKWGVLFTNYDALAVLNMEAVTAVGKWDTVLPQYFADNDYYRRLHLAGYESISTNLAVTHHNVSSTIKSDPSRMFLNSVTFPLYERYYAIKWRGRPGKESCTTPFNL